MVFFKNKITKKVFLTLLLVMMLSFMGCSSQTIKEIKSDDYINKNVKVKGEVLESVKIGTLSGYIIKDSNNDTIAVSSSKLPEKGEKITANGVLKKSLVMYYIETK